MNEPEHLTGELDEESLLLVASTALSASDGMPIHKRIMINRGVAQLFPVGSPERQHAEETAESLAKAELNQMRLTHLLKTRS